MYCKQPDFVQEDDFIRHKMSPNGLICRKTKQLAKVTLVVLATNHEQYYVVDTILKPTLLVIITVAFFDDGHRIKTLDLYQYVG